MDVTKIIQNKLEKGLHSIHINVVDSSAQHARHPGAKESGGGHYDLLVVSESFEEKGLIERHRMIYDLLSEEMGSLIHALAIKAYTPAQWQERRVKSDG